MFIHKMNRGFTMVIIEKKSRTVITVVFGMVPSVVFVDSAKKVMLLRQKRACQYLRAKENLAKNKKIVRLLKNICEMVEPLRGETIYSRELEEPFILG